MDPKELPIRQFADDICAAVAKTDIIVVIGETGSGKTTQLSQILYEKGYAEHGLIAVTQPRRVGAVTVAKRVAEERSVVLGEEVGYGVRFENKSSSNTKIKYMTDGTLLRECLEDPLLQKYEVIILDEAHERSLNTDILFGILKRLVQGNARARPLKLLITSATLDGDKFSAYFGDCPVFNVPGRCYPVEIIHAQEEHLKDYVDAAIDTVLQIHTTQAPGDILVFLTGQAEIDKAIKRINEQVCALPEGAAGGLLVLPLYASLPPELQMRVFQSGPPGARRCIVATNVAETSITVEGVVYVVDSGVVKQKHYHAATGMESLDVVPISRVHATQRAGRAGRTRAGKCFRLYSKQYFESSMPDVALPEIQRTSMAGAVLQIKALQLDLDVLTFDFLDKPDKAVLEEALKQLYVLDAIDADGKITELGRRLALLPLEPSLGRALVAAQELGCLPEMITVAAMLSAEHVFASGVANGGSDAEGRQRRGGPGAATADEKARVHMKGLVEECKADHLLLLRLYQLWQDAGGTRDFCKAYGLDFRGMCFARDIRRQLEGIVGPGNRGFTGGDSYPGRDSDSGRDGGCTASTSAAAAGRPVGPAGGSSGGAGLGHRDYDGSRGSGGEQCRKRGYEDRDGRGGAAGSGGSWGGRGGNGGAAVSQARLTALQRALTVGFANRIARRMRMHNGYRTVNAAGQLAQLHPASSHLQVDEEGLLPEWVIYHELVATTRPFLRQVCPTRFEWVEPFLPKLREVDVARLSGSSAVQKQPAEATGAAAGAGGSIAGEMDAGAKLAKRVKEDSVAAAKARYLARKQQQQQSRKK